MWLPVLTVVLSFLLVLIYLSVLRKDRICDYFADAEHRSQWIGCFLIILFASMPLFGVGVLKGHDLEFHLMRIEGIREGLRDGQFPVKIQPNWMNGYGYAASLFYGDIFLYVPALLRLCGISVQQSYDIFLFLVNISTCLLSYYAFKRFSGNNRIGLLGSFLYTCSVYRLACIYLRSAAGEYLALTFLPVFFVGVYEILFLSDLSEGAESGKKKGNRIEGWLLAGLSYAGILNSHLITAEIVAIFTVFVGLIFWRYTFRRDRMKRILKCAIVLLSCSLGFLVPFLDMSRDSYKFNTSMEGYIQEYGATINQICSLFPNGRGDAWSYSMLDRAYGVSDEMPYALGGGFLAAVVLFLVYCAYYKDERDENVKKCAMFLGAAVPIVWMTTSSFPWDFVQRSLGSLGFMVRNIQFPWRLLGISTLVLTFLSVYW